MQEGLKRLVMPQDLLTLLELISIADMTAIVAPETVQDQMSTRHNLFLANNPPSARILSVAPIQAQGIPRLLLPKDPTVRQLGIFQPLHRRAHLPGLGGTYPK